MRLATPLSVLSAAVAVALGASVASAAPIVNDGFESYATTADLTAVWTGGPATLNTAVGNPGQSAAHPGGTVNSQSFAAVNPTDANPLFLSADIFDDGTPNKRVTVGLRNLSPAENLVELGMYNAAAGARYVFRAVLFASSQVINSGGQNSYGKFNLGTDATGDLNRPTVGWHRYTATIGDTTSTFTLDLGSDGTVDATETITATPTAAGISNVRFGGPSNLSSPGGGANFDNILLQVGVPAAVPEPASLALFGLAGAGLLARRRGA